MVTDRHGGAKDPIVPSFKKPRAEPAGNTVSSLKSEEEKDGWRTSGDPRFCFQCRRVSNNPCECARVGVNRKVGWLPKVVGLPPQQRAQALSLLQLIHELQVQVQAQLPTLRWAIAERINPARSARERLRSEHVRAVLGFVQKTTSRSLWEIFAGKVVLTKAMRAAGFAVLPPIEIERNDEVPFSVDITSDSVLKHLFMLIEEGFVFYVHFGTPCSSFSLARKLDGASALGSRSAPSAPIPGAELMGRPEPFLS